MTQPAETSWAGRDDGDLLGEFVEHRREAAFAEVVRRHSGMVLAVCRSVLGNTPDAEDAAQAVFLTLAAKASTRLSRAPLVGWLHRVAWYVACRAAEARAIRRRHEQEAARMKPSSISPESEPISLEALHAGLARLPDKYRVPLLLHYLEGRTQEEAAALLGCGTRAVAMRLSRGRQMLREKLIRRGAAVSAGVVLAALGSQASASASPVFVSAMAKAATATLAGSMTSLAISAKTLALSKGAINMLFWTKMKVAAVAAVVVLTGSAVGTVLVAQVTTPSVSGAVSQVGSGTVTIQPKTGQAVAVALNDATVVKVNGKVATAADLKVGMSAIAFGPQGQPATEIRSYTPQPAPTQPAPAPQPNVAGTITQVGDGSVTIQPATGQAVTVALNAATAVNVGGKAATAADLKVGMRAYALVPTGQPATYIRAYVPQPPSTQPTPTPTPPPGVSGTITQLGEGSVTIQPKTGQAVAVAINSATVVKVNGKVATAADLKVGMNAIALGTQGQPATEIRAYTPQAAPTQPAPAPTPNVAGTITQVGDGSVTIQPATGQAVTVTLNAATQVNVGGKAATAADLKVGMRAYALVPTGQPATYVRAYTPTTTTTK